MWLVPPGVQIVAGFENYKDEHRHGQLLLTTRNNRLDLADWQSIAGVDGREFLERAQFVAQGANAVHRSAGVHPWSRVLAGANVLIVGALRREDSGSLRAAC